MCLLFKHPPWEEFGRLPLALSGSHYWSRVKLCSPELIVLQATKGSFTDLIEERDVVSLAMYYVHVSALDRQAHAELAYRRSGDKPQCNSVPHVADSYRSPEARPLIQLQDHGPVLCVNILLGVLPASLQCMTLG